ncbi:MAG: SemiSWEET transporter [Bacteroidota bacterium]
MEHFNIGIIAAVLTTLAFVPQAYKTIKTQETENLSLPTFTMILVGTILWCIHGTTINDYPLIFANAITAFLSGIIVFLKIRAMVMEKK